MSDEANSSVAGPTQAELIEAAVAAGVPDELLSAAEEADFPAEAAEIALAMGRIFNLGDEEAAQTYVAPGFVDHEAPEGSPGGPDGYLATAGYMRAAFSDATWQPEDFFATADRFAVRLRFSGVHTGEFLGIPATGRSINVQHLHLYRISGGQVTEHWGGRDDLALLTQLGVFTPGAAPATAGAYAPRGESRA
jgi:predicted ester cyclase